MTTHERVPPSHVGSALPVIEVARSALVREIREELGVDVRVGAAIGRASDGRIRLVVHLARLDGGEPRAHDEHDELRWLTPEEFGEVAWLPIDRDLLVHVVDHLAGTSQSAHAGLDER